jgi:hypothetical protein
MTDATQFDDPTIPEFASRFSYSRFAQSIESSNRYVWADDVRLFLETVVATITQRDQIIPEGAILFRAQQGVEWPITEHEDGGRTWDGPIGYASKRMKPLTDRATEGRANPRGIPVLYLGKTVDTAISEVRPWVGAEVSVARCRVLRNLRTLDLSLGHNSSPFFGNLGRMLSSEPYTAAEKKSEVWNAIDRAFSQPVTQSDNKAEYAPTQILTELFKHQGYDAITYKSQFGNEDGYNIAVFDPDAVDIVSCAPYQVRSITVDALQFGNDWYKHVPA